MFGTFHNTNKHVSFFFFLFFLILFTLINFNLKQRNNLWLDIGHNLIQNNINRRNSSTILVVIFCFLFFIHQLYIIYNKKSTASHFMLNIKCLVTDGVLFKC